MQILYPDFARLPLQQHIQFHIARFDAARVIMQQTVNKPSHSKLPSYCAAHKLGEVNEDLQKKKKITISESAHVRCMAIIIYVIT